MSEPAHGPATGTTAAVSLEHVVQAFGQLVAVDGISLSVDHGSVFGLLGHNGAGKTTLIRVINGLLRPSRGSVSTLGFDPIAQGFEVRRRTGVLTEYPALDPFLTCLENLSVYAAIYDLSPAEAANRSQALLERLGLSEHRDAPAHSLSAGLKQRLALARALVHNPELLLLDEPTSNLDPLAARGVRDLIIDLAREQGRTVVISTHNLAEAQQICDRVAIIQRGRLLASGPLASLKAVTAASRSTFAVAPDRRTDAMASLAAIGLPSPVPLGDPARFEVAILTDQVPDAVRQLVAHDIDVTAVEPHEPTLEDIYMSLHDGQDAFGAPTARTAVR